MKKLITVNNDAVLFLLFHERLPTRRLDITREGMFSLHFPSHLVDKNRNLKVQKMCCRKDNFYQLEVQ